jgi:MucR family transcriptional regulator, transcriptional regulator of exopolysaccharide biosynthesis
MADEAKYQRAYPQHVTRIIASYVSHHSVALEQLPQLIGSVRRTLDDLGKPVQPESAPAPAVPLRRSVQPDAVVCLECGWRGKMLRRHLATRHGLNGEDYLRRWNLPLDHPLTAPAYSAQRSTLARALGLGRGGRRPAATTRAAAASSDGLPRRRGRPRGSGRAARDNA